MLFPKGIRAPCTRREIQTTAPARGSLASFEMLEPCLPPDRDPNVRRAGWQRPRVQASPMARDPLC